MAMVMTLCPLTASAASTPSTDTSVSTSDTGGTRGNVYPYTSSSNYLFVDGTWRIIAYSTSGFNCKVYMDGLVSSNYIHVRMLNSSGNVIWSENNSLATYSGGRTYWCGSNVYTIQVKCDSSGIAWAYQV